MCKLLHLIYAVWKTNRPFDPKHFDWEPASDTPVSTTPASDIPASTILTSDTPVSTTPTSDTTASTIPASGTPVSTQETALGHKRDEPAKPVVTTANPGVVPTPPPVKPTSANRPLRPKVDFAFLRERVTMEQVLSHLGVLDNFRGRGRQRRGPCPVPGHPNDTGPTFSAHLGKHVFQWFHADCQAHGNVLDLWVAMYQLPLYEAALHLAETFQLPSNREEEPVQGTRESKYAGDRS